MKANRIVWFVIALCMGVGVVSAQRMITVSGRVMQKVIEEENGQKKENIKPFQYVHIYAFPGKLEAEETLRQYNNTFAKDRNALWQNYIDFMYQRPYKEGNTAVDGSYSISDAPENGYLIFFPFTGDPRIVAIDGMLEIEDVVFEADADAYVIKDLVVTADDLGVKIDGETCGDLVTVRSSLPVEEELLKKNVRIVIQPYFVDCNPSSLPVEQQKDTMFLSPFSCYGTEMDLTQERRLNFNLKLDSIIQVAIERDSLIQEGSYVPITRKFRIPDPNRQYKAYAEVYYEDYTGVVKKDSFVIKHCESKEPMRFLDFNFGASFLDPADPDFNVKPIVSQQDAVGDINLTFVVGRAELDSKNPNNDVEIARLQDEMLAIENSGNNVLRTLTIIGKASPEGSYESNKALAARRIAFASNKIVTAFDRFTRKRLKITETPVVAGWDEVADSMEVDSLFDEATAIREIVTANEGNFANQYAKIRALPYYNSVIKEVYLPKLRAVKYQYTYQTMRSLTDKEILDKWQVAKDSANKVVHFDRYEFWRLVNLVKDTADQYKIYKRYYEYTRKTLRIHDELPSCNYAAFLIRDGICDTTILKPFIKMNRKMDYRQMNANEEWETYNREAVLANQLAMYVYSKNYLNAGILGLLLPDTESNALLKAFLKCMMGLYRKPHYYEPVAATSTNNKIVINIALGDGSRLREAQMLCQEEMEDTNPRKFYFLAQINEMLKADTRDVVDNLVQCFKLDESFTEIADMDATFVDNKGKKPKLNLAMDQFLKWKTKKTSGATEEATVE